MTRRTAASTALAAPVALAAGGCGSAAVPPRQTILGGTIRSTSATGATAKIDTAWRTVPALARYSVQSLTYTKSSLDRVLSICEQGAAGDTFASLQSDQLIACAPLIYYLYSYGRRHDSAPAMAAGVGLYDFAVTHVVGPASSEAELNTTLRSWGARVAAGALPAPRSGDPTAVAASEIQSVYDSIEREAGVDVTITQDSGAGTNHLLATSEQLGPASGRTEIQRGSSSATITATNGTVYLTGAGGGLNKLLGVPAEVAGRAGGHPIAVSSKDGAYETLLANVSLSAVPSELLPATTDVRITQSGRGRTRRSRLTWTTTSTAASATTTHVLVVRDGSIPLPEELIESSRGLRAVTHLSWELPSAIEPPAGAISFATLSRSSKEPA